MNSNTSFAVAVSVFSIALFSGLAFSNWSNDQVKIECYKVNVELAKQNKPVEPCFFKKEKK